MIKSTIKSLHPIASNVNVEIHLDLKPNYFWWNFYLKSLYIWQRGLGERKEQAEVFFISERNIASQRALKYGLGLPLNWLTCQNKCLWIMKYSVSILSHFLTLPLLLHTPFGCYINMKFQEAAITTLSHHKISIHRQNWVAISEQGRIVDYAEQIVHSRPCYFC